MTQQTIEVEGLPEGWKAVAYRLGKEGEMAFINKVWELEEDSLCPVIIVEKIQPRRKVLEEFKDASKVPDYYKDESNGCFLHADAIGVELSEHYTTWKEVKE